MGSPQVRQVIGTAIVVDGRVLAARRIEPASLAGGWELPGGKVDPGETLEQACVREIREELGCAVKPVRMLEGEQWLRDDLVLRVCVAEMVEGEPDPAPHEHDALRWLGPEELYDVAWLPADQPFLPQLKETLLDGSTLTGGNVGGAVRIGETVRRPTGPWTPAVHALLDHLAAAGLSGVPRVLGYDERGREVLTYLPGEVIDVAVARLTDDRLADTMRWLRRFHDTVRGYRPAGRPQWRFEERAVADGEIVCHHDVAPYNCAFRGDRLIGVFDWDVAGPGRPIDDLAFAAWNGVPLWRETGDEAERLRVMADAYGGVDPLDILRGTVPRIDGAIRKIGEGQAAGDPGMLNLATVGEPERTRRSLAALKDRLPRIEQALLR